ncbi:SRPBCC family protein [Flavobacterium aquidurense]|uniref:SRPBCC family protein n=1 Tax=Flavobacterium aquidurense TaxID=362413 RepID=UPI0037177628
MKSISNFTQTLTMSQTPQKVFEVILKVRKWWTGYHDETFTGMTEKLNDEFTFHAGNGAHYSKQKIVEIIPNQKVVWLITDSKLSFLEKTDEWTGTKVIFEISTEADRTKLTFTHEGLSPEVECYNSCAPAWTEYLQNKLLPLLSIDKVI